MRRVGGLDVDGDRGGCLFVYVDIGHPSVHLTPPPPPSPHPPNKQTPPTTKPTNKTNQPTNPPQPSPASRTPPRFSRSAASSSAWATASPSSRPSPRAWTPSSSRGPRYVRVYVYVCVYGIVCVLFHVYTTHTSPLPPSHTYTHNDRPPHHPLTSSILNPPHDSLPHSLPFFSTTPRPNRTPTASAVTAPLSTCTCWRRGGTTTT